MTAPVKAKLQPARYYHNEKRQPRQVQLDWTSARALSGLLPSLSTAAGPTFFFLALWFVFWGNTHLNDSNNNTNKWVWIYWTEVAQFGFLIDFLFSNSRNIRISGSEHSSFPWCDLQKCVFRLGDPCSRLSFSPLTCWSTGTRHSQVPVLPLFFSSVSGGWVRKPAGAFMTVQSGLRHHTKLSPSSCNTSFLSHKSCICCIVALLCKTFFSLSFISCGCCSLPWAKRKGTQ